MATIVLTAIGMQFGGPIGGAIGSALGQVIDRAVFGGSKTREGPRLKQLDVQTSSYGTQFPAIFGAMRVAGTVIWSTDLIERRVKSGGGKGRPSSVNYSYSASFAVALSSRPVSRIGRIWADGNLLRGVAGDFKTETDFRFHPGHGDQPLDPLLASAEALGSCPAYRGLAYAVFEDLQLADFGNRIPSLTFEIFEREASVPVSEIATVASAGTLVGESETALTGYALQGSDCRSALHPMLAALPVFVRPSGDHLRLDDWTTSAAENLVNDPAVADGKSQLGKPGRSRHAGGNAPGSVSIRHYDPARDFQAGVQASRTIGRVRTDLQIDLPASVDASAVKGFADLQLLQRWRGLNGMTLSLPHGADAISAGNRLSGDTGALRITEIEHLRGTTRISASEWTGHVPTAHAADPGRNQPEPDLTSGETRLMVVELPALSTDDPARSAVAIAAAGTESGWRRAALSLKDSDRTVELGGTNGIATIGQLVDDLPAHTPMLLDSGSQPVIRLLHDMMTLPPGTGDVMAFDAPSLWIDGEIVRYGIAEKIGACDYRLSALLRGCFGTGGASLAHSAGSEILLLEPQSMLALNAVPTPVGTNVAIEALGLGDVEPVEASLLVQGLAISPRAPVHGQLERHADGGIALNWLRRDRLAHVWADGADMPDSEGGGQFIVELGTEGGMLASWTSTSESLLLSATEIAALSITPGSTMIFSIVHQGRFARSAPLTLTTIF